MNDNGQKSPDDLAFLRLQSQASMLRHGVSWLLAWSSVATTCLALTKGPVNQTVDDKASHAPLATPDRSSEAVNLSWDSTEDMHNTTPDSDLQSTAGMDDDTLWERKLMFAGIILGSTLILVLFSVCVLKCQQAKKSSKQVQPDGSGWKHEKSGESKSGGGTSYKYESLLKGKSSDNCEDDADGQGWAKKIESLV